MNIVLFVYSAALLGIALIGFIPSGSNAALLPAYFAVIFIILGVLSLKNAWHKKCIQIAVVLTTLIMLIYISSLNDFVTILVGNEVIDPLFVVLHFLLFLVSFLFLSTKAMLLIISKKHTNKNVL